jgi:hypothetical protein
MRVAFAPQVQPERWLQALDATPWRLGLGL